jgi:acetylornithine/succinyldiaminopimelate/putrescine aminotransferase
MVELAAALAEVTPGGTNRRVLLCQSGREALARGIELARTATGRSGVLYLSGNAALDASSLQGAAAVVAHPFDARLAAARKATDRAGAWLVDDETRIAPGTTGRMLAVEHSGVRPDLYVLGPGAAAGLPFGACITGSSKHCFREPADSPSRAACIAGLAYLGLLKSGLVDRGLAIGDRFERAAKDGPDCSPGKWFGTGTHWSLVFDGPRLDTGRLVANCRERGLLVASAGAASIAVRPALVITDAELDTALNALAGAITDVARRRVG